MYGTAEKEYVSINDFVSKWFVSQSLVFKGLSVLTTSKENRHVKSIVANKCAFLVKVYGRQKTKELIVY